MLLTVIMLKKLMFHEIWCVGLEKPNIISLTSTIVSACSAITHRLRPDLLVSGLYSDHCCCFCKCFATWQYHHPHFYYWNFLCKCVCSSACLYNMCIINLFALLFQIATEENRLCHGGKVKPCWLQRVTVFPLVSSEYLGERGKTAKIKQILVWFLFVLFVCCLSDTLM